MLPRDFRGRRSFPGLEGGPFEIIVVTLDRLAKIPTALFFGILGLLALLASRGDLRGALMPAAFFLGDWLLLGFLPRLGISFGPPKPPTLLLALLRLPAFFLPSPASLIAEAIGTALVVYGFYIEPQRLVVSHHRLQTPKWGPGPSLRLAHFGDLHMERMTRRERRLLEALHRISPDVIVISGDFLSYSNVDDREAWLEARRVLSELEAPLGVFAASGSPPVDTEESLQFIFEGTRVRWLRDETVTIRHGPNELLLIGVSCTHKPFLDAPRLEAVRRLGNNRFAVLLYHSPDLAPEAAALGIDLQLSGHTHGGQVRLPLVGALYPSSLYGKKLEVGRRRLGPMTLYVTRGLGLEGKGAPRVRFLSPPELAVWEISGP
jgi:predicted MPP superfamily phosphohydrolase